MKNPRSGYNMLLYGCTLGDPDKPDGYLLINSALVPVGSTVDIIKRQLMIITITAIIGIHHIAVPVKTYRTTYRQDNQIRGKPCKGRFQYQIRRKRLSRGEKACGYPYLCENELSRVDTMQRDLIANVSHDLRTPLTMLKAYAEMIRDLSGDNPVKRNEHLEIIISETDRLSLMVNDILDLSKLESGKQKLNPSEFEICGKLSEIIDRFKGISEKMGYQHPLYS